ncbi:ABC transporter ATP-binding protein [Candidatus Paracaedibacter symbiosus]|uniref:ABC transporter ATP-binding protein n=1 Tax=Candidatus Paracaedibacter symbiosus TaxID=244582 RepID=UPI00050982B9|nr:ABC transporter ATP-binding protein [Candidatus Paracaedibacter symbiosus]
MTQETLVLNSVTRSFSQGDEHVNVLRQVNLTIKAGEIVALVGQSGAGKSTLLQIAGLLEPPTSGKVFVNGKDTSFLSDVEKTELRRNYIGFVYQFHYLLPEFSALENVIIPQLIAGKSEAEAKARAEELLAILGLSHRFLHRPKKLSGGEQQRVAIARAIANTPKILLADEPTGNLDYQTSDIVFGEMLKIVRETGLSALIATHNPELASKMDRIIRVHDGIVV